MKKKKNSDDKLPQGKRSCSKSGNTGINALKRRLKAAFEELIIEKDDDLILVIGDLEFIIGDYLDSIGKEWNPDDRVNRDLYSDDSEPEY